MGNWGIHELNKDKTILSIANEEARLDHCKIERERLIRERDRYKIEADRKLAEYYEKIGRLNFSINSSEQFVNECKEHLKDFENVEGN